MKLSLLLLTVFLCACSENHTPKPRGLFKVDLPAKNYERINVDCDFSFEKPSYSILRNLDENCFYNLHFPDQNAVLHITYLHLQDNLSEHIEQSRSFAYKHDVIADAISETVYVNHESKVYSLLYDYAGVTATSTQFYITDSTSHFFRGALYFNNEVTDSLLPINNFLKDDVKHIIETFRWEKR